MNLERIERYLSSNTIRELPCFLFEIIIIYFRFLFALSALEMNVFI